MDCQTCGSPVAQGAAYCGRCGARVLAPRFATAPGMVPPEMRPIAPPPGPLSPASEQVATRPYGEMPSGARVAVAVAGIPLALMAAFLLRSTAASLMNASDGAFLEQGATMGLVAGIGLAVAAGFALVAARRRVESESWAWIAGGAGVLAGALVALVMVTAAQDLARAPVELGYAVGAESFGFEGFLLAFAAGGALVAGGAMGGKNVSAPWVALVAACAAFAAAFLLFDGWLMLNAPALRAIASTRTHRGVPFPWALVPLALAALALLLRRPRG